MHYYQFNIGDYRKKTGHLTLVEHAIYRALIDSYYLTENPLELDVNKLMRSHSARTIEEKEAFNNVLGEFFVKSEDGYFHQNCDDQIKKIYIKSDKARASAKARWAKKDAKGMQEQCERIEDECERKENGCESDATHYPLPNNPLPKPKALDESEINREFERIWDLYGKKGNRKTSKARYSKLSETVKQKILNHIPDYVLSTPEKKFRKDFQSYLNQEAWNDEVITNDRQNQSGQHPTTNKLTPLERVQAKRAEAARRGGDVGPMGNDDQAISPCLDEQGGGGTYGNMGAVIDGAYTRTD